MRRILLTISLCLVFPLIFSQNWKSSSRIIATEDISEINSVVDSEGGVLTFGYFSGTLTSNTGLALDSYGGRDYFLVKFSDLGEAEWVKQFGGDANDYVLGGIASSDDGFVFVTGGYQNFLKYDQNDTIFSSGIFDTFLAKLDLDGNVIWCQNIGEGSSNQRPNAIEVTSNNRVLVTGFFNDSIRIINDTTLYSNNTAPNHFIASFSGDDGGFDWVKSFNTISASSSGRFFQILATENSFYFAGTFKDSIDLGIDTIVSRNSTIDCLVLKTDTLGNIFWFRKIQGDGDIYSYSLALDPFQNVIVGGYFESPDLELDENGASTILSGPNNGAIDMFVTKYSSTGDLIWNKTNGGKGEDRIYGVEYFENQIRVAGFISDTVFWGGIQLISNGTNDIDMFYGSLDDDGNYRGASNYSGRNNSTEEARAIFYEGIELRAVIRSNSDLLVLGDSIYTSTSGTYYIVLGIIGCLPISVDNVIVQDVATCYGDSTGSLQILASGGFGSPWQYSIDNGLNYQADISYFGSLPAGNYPVVVIDQENCAQPGNLVVVGQPDSLKVELFSSTDITLGVEGSIVVTASGGSAPYTYTLQPGGVIQGFGTYSFGAGDSGVYVVEVNDLRNCGPVATDSITILDLSSVNINNFSDLQFKVYPNPTSGMITVEMPYEGLECSLEILSLTGQVVRSRQVYSSGGVIRETLDVSDLSKGMYMLRVNGQTLKSGIVVN